MVRFRHTEGLCPDFCGIGADGAAGQAEVVFVVTNPSSYHPVLSPTCTDSLHLLSILRDTRAPFHHKFTLQPSRVCVPQGHQGTSVSVSCPTHRSEPRRAAGTSPTSPLLWGHSQPREQGQVQGTAHPHQPLCPGSSWERGQEPPSLVLWP